MPPAKQDEKLLLMLSELAATRLCHDLAGPIGALNNGVEFLAESAGEEGAAEQAVDLLKMSAQEARAKLQLFRMAYGVTNADAKADVAEMKEILEDYFGYSKTKILWTMQGDVGFFTTAMRQMLANMVLVTSSALLMGGTLEVVLSVQGGAAQIETLGKSAKVKQDEEVKGILTGAGNVAPTSKLVPALLLNHYAVARKANITYRATDNSFHLTLNLPF